VPRRSTPNLAFAFNLEPREAVDYMRRKGARLSFDWWDVWQDAHARAFTVAKVVRMDVLEDIRRMVLEALEKGLSLEAFREQLEPKLKAKGWWGYQDIVNPKTGQLERVLAGTPWRLKTIFRTNLQSAYMAGRWRQFQANKAARPYLQYVAVMDSKTRPSHAALHGKVFHIDDPFWRTHYPPLGFNCRCRVRALSEKNVRDRGITVESSQGRISVEEVEVSPGVVKPVAVYEDPSGLRIPTDAGFSFNPGMESFTPDLGKYSPRIAALASRARFGFVHRFGEVGSRADLERFTFQLLEENREMFPQPILWARVRRLPRPTTIMQTTSVSGGVGLDINTSSLLITDPVTRRIVTFRPDRDFKSALNKIRSGGTLTFVEEYTIETLWHEMLHMRALRLSLPRNVEDLAALETANQFVARHTYDRLMRILGGEASLQTQIIENGLGYSETVKNLRSFLVRTGVPTERAVANLQFTLLNKDYSRMFMHIKSTLSNLTSLPEERMERILSMMISLDNEHFMRALERIIR